MKLTKEDLNKSLEIQFQKDLKDLLEVVDLYNKSNKMLFENRLSKEEYETLNEGLWEKVKYGLSKLGRYKAGGKILGKGKIDQEAAKKLEKKLALVTNDVAKKILDNLDEKLEQMAPGFPNNKKEQGFLTAIEAIVTIYDSVVEATKKNPKEKKYLPTDVANIVIDYLAEYVQKALDVDLTAVYSVMDSEKDKVKDAEGNEELLTDEVEDIKDKEKDPSKVRATLQAKKGDAADRDSERMKTLKSNKLPLLLTAVGGSLGALGWLAQTDWLKTLLESWLNKKGIPGEDAIYQTFTGGHGGDPKGFLHWANQIDPSNPMKTGADVSNFVNKMGAENVSHMFDGNGAGDSMDQVSKLQQLVGGDNANKSVGELFQGDTYGDMKQGRNLFGISKAASFTAKVLIKQAVKGVAGSTAGTVLATKIAAVGSVLAPLGVAVFATGALVKLMRMKGQKQSRAKTLQDLLNYIQPIKAEEASLPAVLDIEANKPKEERTGGGKEKSEKPDNEIYKDIVNLLKFTVNSKKGKEPEDSKNPCLKLKVGMEVLYKPFKDNKEDIFIVKNLTNVLKGKVQLQRKGNEGTAGITYTDCSKVKLIKSDKNENVINKNKKYIMENSLLTEGRFIKNPELIKKLKNSGIDSNKIKFLDGFLTRLEVVRNRIRKMKPTGDKIIDRYLNKLQNNEIIKTNFVNLFNINPKNEKGIDFIKSYLEFVFKFDYKKRIGFNIDKLEESYTIKEAEGRGRGPRNSLGLKRSTIKSMARFMADLIKLFQRMYQLKKEGNLSGGTKKPTKTKPEPKQESVKKVNPLLTEEINKIKNLMFKIS